MIDPTFQYYPPPPPTRKELHDMLYARAIFNIVSNDVTDLKNTLEYAQLKNIPHLLDKGAWITAVYSTHTDILDIVLKQDIPMTRAELKGVLLLMPTEVEKCRATLHDNNVAIVFDQEELKKLSPVHIIENARHLKNSIDVLSHSTHSVVTLKKRMEKDFNGIENFYFIQSLLQGDLENAKKIADYCQKMTIGKDKTTITNVIHMNTEIVDMMNMNKTVAQNVLQNLSEIGYRARPLFIENVCDILDATDIKDHAETLHILRDAGLLAHTAPYLRRRVIERWLQDGLDHQNKHITKHYRQQAMILFDQNANIAKEDVTFVKDLFKKHRRPWFFQPEKTQDVFFDIAKTLEQTTFFNHPLIQEKDMSFFKKICPDSLKKFFNAKAHEKRHKTYGENGFAQNTRFADVEKFISETDGPLSATHTQKVLDYLSGTTRGRLLSDRQTGVIKMLLDKKSDFSKIDPMAYMGARGPGVAKALLDMDIVTAKQFDVETLMGGEKLYWDMHFGGDAKTEFICQVVLEQHNAEKYKPLRQKEHVLYTLEFMKSPLFKPTGRSPYGYFGRGI